MQPDRRRHDLTRSDAPWGVTEDLGREIIDDVLKSLRAEADIEWFPEASRLARKALTNRPVDLKGN